MLAPHEEFRAFYDAEVAGLFRLALRLTGNRSQAEDLAQDAMVRTYRAWKRISDRERPVAYARTALINRHRSLLRRTLVEARHRPEPPTDIAGPDADQAAIRYEITQLPVRQRQALVLHFYEDLPQTEVAQILGCRPGTVNSLVFRGLERLRARLGDDTAQIPARSEQP